MLKGILLKIILWPLVNFGLQVKSTIQEENNFESKKFKFEILILRSPPSNCLSQLPPRSLHDPYIRDSFALSFEQQSHAFKVKFL